MAEQQIRSAEAASTDSTTAATTSAGRVVLPGDFNNGRNKLFFFWNQEFLPRTNPGNLERRTMPTELERAATSRNRSTPTAG